MVETLDHNVKFVIEYDILHMYVYYNSSSSVFHQSGMQSNGGFQNVGFNNSRNTGIGYYGYNPWNKNFGPGGM